MSFQFRPARRENTPLIIGLAGPTKSGKTLSAHRLAVGLANGGTVAMVNSEGPRGHQYADRYSYVSTEIVAPFSPPRYEAAIREAGRIKPAVLVVDSVSHMHDGPGGLLEWHDEEQQRIAAGKSDAKALDRANMAAWIRPKKAENLFIYAMLELSCHVILCFRAKEKIKIVPGQPMVDLGWQPIVSDRVAFETIFTLMLPPHSKGVPDLGLSEMREPFDEMVPVAKQLDEDLGKRLAAWANAPAQSPQSAAPQAPSPQPSSPAAPAAADDPNGYITPDQALKLEALCEEHGIVVGRLKLAAQVERLIMIKAAHYERALAWVSKAIAAAANKKGINC